MVNTSAPVVPSASPVEERAVGTLIGSALVSDWSSASDEATELVTEVSTWFAGPGFALASGPGPWAPATAAFRSAFWLVGWSAPFVPLPGCAVEPDPVVASVGPLVPVPAVSWRSRPVVWSAS